MQQIMTAVPAPGTPVHPRAAAATVTGPMRPPPTVSQHDHTARWEQGPVSETAASRTTSGASCLASIGLLLIYLR